MKITIVQQDTRSVMMASKNETCKQLLIRYLQKISVPIVYVPVCGLLQNTGTGQRIIQSKEKLSNCCTDSQELQFHILVQPYNVYADQMPIEFVNLYFTQLHYYIVQNEYIFDKEDFDLLHCLAAYECAMNFGEFDAKKHKKGFLMKILDKMVPKAALKKFSLQQLEQMVFNDWKYFSEEKLVQTREQAVRNYIGTTAEYLPQYGCFVVNVQFEGKQVKFGVRQSGIYVQNAKGSSILEARFQQISTQYQNDVLCVTTRGKDYYFKAEELENLDYLMKRCQQVFYPEEGGVDEEIEKLLIEDENYANELLKSQTLKSSVTSSQMRDSTVSKFVVLKQAEKVLESQQFEVQQKQVKIQFKQRKDITPQDAIIDK